MATNFLVGDGAKTLHVGQVQGGSLLLRSMLSKGASYTSNDILNGVRSIALVQCCVLRMLGDSMNTPYST